MTVTFVNDNSYDIYYINSSKKLVLNNNMSDDFPHMLDDKDIDNKLNRNMNNFKGRGILFVENNIKLENGKLILNTSKLDHEIDCDNVKYKYGSSIITSK